MVKAKARRNSGWKPEDLAEVNEDNDDEAELAQVAEVKRQASEAAQASPYGKETPGRKGRLMDSYADCMKMCNENKVTMKNSWNLDLIDDLKRVVDQTTSNGSGEEMTDFQRASCTLEAGTKIYEYRVDSVYNEAYKLKGSLGRQGKADVEEEDDGEGEGEGGEGETERAPGEKKKEKEKAKRRAAAAGTAFLEANPESLCVKKLELAFDVDPLFERTSAKFDEGGAKGLLLHNLQIQPGCALVLDSSDHARPAVAPTAASAVPLRCISNLLPRNCLALHVSSEFSENHEPAAREWANGSGCRVAPDAEPEPLPEPDEQDDAEDETMSDGGGEEPADFGTSWDEPGDFSEEPEANDRERALQQVTQGDADGRYAIGEVDEMLEGCERTPEEVVHEKAQQLLQAGWAGPGHWKFRAAPKPKAGGGGGGGGGKTKNVLVLDFGQRAEKLKELQEMPLDAKGTTLTEAALAKLSEADNTLPEDCHCSVDALCQLFHKPELRVRPGRHVLRSAQQSHDDEARADDVQIDGFSDGGGEEQPDFGDDWQNDGGEDDDHIPLNADRPDSGMQMVSQPTKVQKIAIGYAKRDKRVDIKGLKQSLWELLSDEQSAADPAERQMSGEATLQQVVSRLPEKVPEPKLPDISMAYNFICLLHLANEKGLELVANESSSDLSITQPPAPAPAKASKAKAK